MSIHGIANVCSQLVNCSMARGALVSIPYTKLHLAIMLGLYRHGVVSAVNLGGQYGPHLTPQAIETEPVSSRRLWITLKYKDGTPVLKNAGLVMASKDFFEMKRFELVALLHGATVKRMRPIAPGELLFIKTDKGILEGREAAAIGRGGQALCRFST
ncbi:mitochondrial 37S ribosomal protein MRPS8 [Myxozyma melibiosi]|uniref:Mitochondrial 37S ribosomal protein MRPS8 n=1 Tax=Myxozyma melibiosi TaxID=54550 RepID=A0ABR1EZR3_9ASCO